METINPDKAKFLQVHNLSFYYPYYISIQVD